jgi:hypothetical protein
VMRSGAGGHADHGDFPVWHGGPPSLRLSGYWSSSPMSRSRAGLRRIRWAASRAARRRVPMLIKSRMGVSVDGFVADADGVPAIALADGFVPGESHGFPEFIAGCDAPGS